MKKKITSKVCFSFFLLLLLNGGFPSALLAIDDSPRRFSMAISGGASKGAYEAGLNWGLLKILQNVGKIDSLYGGQSRQFEAASFSGASAGGINTLLSGLGSCSLPESDGGLPNRIEANIFRDVWLIPDVNRLLPPRADSPYYNNDDALLSRHDLLQASGLLREHWNKPLFRPGCRIPLGVTVTRVIPAKVKVGNILVRNQRFFIPFDAKTRNDGRLGFEFNPDRYSEISDPAMILIPQLKKATAFSIEDQQIEDAVLTSAAYPGGFGRKRLAYCRLTSYVETEEQDANKSAIPKKTTVETTCPDGYELAEAEFADGGLFDNLPLGLARQLAEKYKHANKNPLPVTYIYIDPNRLRYKTPLPEDTSACAGDNPPEACRVMEFSFLTENSLLLGALGTARKYELYRELTSEYWTLNLPQLSYEVAENLQTNNPRARCEKEIPFFDRPLSCSESIARAGKLLEIVYGGSPLPISPPYSASQLRKAGIAYNCRSLNKNQAKQNKVVCEINVIQYRKRLAKILQNVVTKKEYFSGETANRIQESKLSIHNDRILRVTSRGVPITGTLLSDFGAFLDLKFREYDYYIGVYDAVIAASQTICGLQYSPKDQQKSFKRCQDAYADSFHSIVGLDKDARGQYVFARAAQWEFGKTHSLQFAYSTLPKEDRDMRIIFDGLIKALEAGEQDISVSQAAFFTEDTFFLHLYNEGFVATPTDNGSTPLLTQIISDPTKWPSELIRRVTTRMVYLEQQAEKIYTAREPDPQKRETAHTTLMGITAHSLQTATYNYPEYTFATSTAPENWGWRYAIPYEASLDLAEGDIIFTWQPTWAVSNKDLFVLRASLGFAGGLFDSRTSELRENYGALGLGYTRRTGSGKFSSWGITPTGYHTWKEPEIGKQNSFGADVHASFFKDKLRVGLGARDLSDASETWFLTIGLTDLPGLTYWLSR